ncbi:hypothetical protein M5K25_026586 [Dendrobium thyrsiflorum]|uniref:Uncharacterized protein n=1 Tax=Dendrobium thyrsiflorum TaxID=117978 RepID=A0ABD0TY62_DENTH
MHDHTPYNLVEERYKWGDFLWREEEDKKPRRKVRRSSQAFLEGEEKWNKLASFSNNPQTPYNLVEERYKWGDFLWREEEDKKPRRKVRRSSQAFLEEGEEKWNKLASFPITRRFGAEKVIWVDKAIWAISSELWRSAVLCQLSMADRGPLWVFPSESRFVLLLAEGFFGGATNRNAYLAELWCSEVLRRHGVANGYSWFGSSIVFRSDLLLDEDDFGVVTFLRVILAELCLAKNLGEKSYAVLIVKACSLLVLEYSSGKILDSTLKVVEFSFGFTHVLSLDKKFVEGFVYEVSACEVCYASVAIRIGSYVIRMEELYDVGSPVGGGGIMIFLLSFSGSSKEDYFVDLIGQQILGIPKCSDGLKWDSIPLKLMDFIGLFFEVQGLLRVGFKEAEILEKGAIEAKKCLCFLLASVLAFEFIRQKNVKQSVPCGEEVALWPCGIDDFSFESMIKKSKIPTYYVGNSKFDLIVLRIFYFRNNLVSSFQKSPVHIFWSGMARKFVEKGSGYERTADIESLDRGWFDRRFSDLEMSDFCVLGLVGLVSSSPSIRL